MARKQYPYTQEELTEYLIKKRDELGRVPTRKDIPEKMRPYYRVYFGKWCYALEETGVVTPSKETLERRARKKARYDEKHQKMRAKSKAMRAERRAKRIAEESK